MQEQININKYSIRELETAMGRTADAVEVRKKEAIVIFGSIGQPDDHGKTQVGGSIRIHIKNKK